MLPVEGEIELGGAPAEGESGGESSERLGDGRCGNAGDGRLAVHRGAVGLEHVERPLRVEHDACLGEHVERGLMDAFHVGRLQEPERPPRPDVASVGVAGHESPFETPEPVAGAASPRPTYSTATNGDVTARTSAS